MLQTVKKKKKRKKEKPEEKLCLDLREQNKTEQNQSTKVLAGAAKRGVRNKEDGVSGYQGSRWWTRIFFTQT